MNTMILLSDVISFIKENQGIGSSREISESTLLESDLGITGDDGIELLEDLEKRFDISFAGSDGSLREAFGLEKNEFLFHGEGFDFFGISASLFGRAHTRVKALSVGELHRVIVSIKNRKS